MKSSSQSEAANVIFGAYESSQSPLLRREESLLGVCVYNNHDECDLIILCVRGWVGYDKNDCFIFHVCFLFFNKN